MTETESPAKIILEFKPNARGFITSKFTDRYGAKCSLQKSSLAFEDAIWFGVDDTEPKIMAADAKKLGRDDLLDPTKPIQGWVDWPIPDEVLISSRMHLTREHVRQLLPALQTFADTGELPREPND